MGQGARNNEGPPLGRLGELAERVGARELAAIEEVAESAVTGDARATRRYVAAYRQLVRKVYEALEAEAPGSDWSAKRFTALGRARPVLFGKTAKHAGPRLAVLLAVLEPALHEEEFVTCLSKIFEARHRWEQTVQALSERQRMDFMRRVPVAMPDGSPLIEIRETFQLSDTELAELLQVTRQAVQKWIELDEIPARRRVQVYALQKIARLLRDHLKSDRIPAVIRRDSDWFGGRSLFAALKDGQYELVLRKVREGFDWGRAA